MKLVRTVLAVTAGISGFFGLAVGPSQASPANGSTCQLNSHSGSFGGAHGVLVAGRCVPLSAGPGPQLLQKVVSCGIWVPGGKWDKKQCGTTTLNCYQVKPGVGNVQVPAYATLTLVNGQWSKPQVWCPGDPQPAVTMAAIRAQAFRLLPRLTVDSAWKQTALVNAQVILWVPTPTNRPLPTVTILGQQVDLQISLTSVHWDFGDGTSDATTDPGAPYDAVNNPCHTAQCPGYYGHIYKQTGKITITATTNWHAQYRLNGGAWTDLAGAPLAAPPSQHTMQILQARGVLVPNPGDH